MHLRRNNGSSHTILDIAVLEMYIDLEQKTAEKKMEKKIDS